VEANLVFHLTLELHFSENTINAGFIHNINLKNCSF